MKTLSTVNFVMCNDMGVLDAQVLQKEKKIVFKYIKMDFGIRKDEF